MKRFLVPAAVIGAIVLGALSRSWRRHSDDAPPNAEAAQHTAAASPWDAVIAITIGAVLALLLIWGTVALFNLPLLRARRSVPKEDWTTTAKIAMQKSPRPRLLRIGPTELQVIRRNGSVEFSIPWERISHVAYIETMLRPKSRVNHIGVGVFFRDGSSIPLLLPTKGGVFYPRRRAEETAGRINEKVLSFRAQAAPHYGQPNYPNAAGAWR